MKNSSFKFLLAILLCSFFISCKKDSPTEKTVVGYWKGKYTENSAQKDWNWLVRSNMTVRVFIGADTTSASKFEGTYTTTDTTIRASYLISGNLGTSFTGRLNDTYTRITGTDFTGTTYFLEK